MSLETMTKLATVSVGVGGTSSINFTNIPQNYTDLQLVLSARSTQGDYEVTDVNVSFNGVTTNQSERNIRAYPTASTLSQTRTSIILGNMPSAINTSNTFANNSLYIYNYANSTFKCMSVEGVTPSNTNSSPYWWLNLGSNLWSDVSAITSITLQANNGSFAFAQHSKAILYGIKNARQTAGNSIKATGGNIVFDGTYVYHAFTSTGTFVPTQPLLTDMLVIGGGAGGGGGRAGNHYGGGGGSGAALTFASQYLTLGSYAVTVGAGGAGGTNSASYSQGTNGSSSQFGALTVATGGGGGGSGNTVGLAGASGGGGGGFLNTSPAGGAGNQGFAGGNGAAAYRGGGGGGAGAAGSNGNADAGAGGPGGIGLTSTLINALCSATGVGQNVGGTWYVAGGGAGTPEGSLGGFGGGGAGMDTTLPITRGFGLGGSGSGGGGGTAGAGAEAGGTGGSGIVIIRYKG